MFSTGYVASFHDRHFRAYSMTWPFLAMGVALAEGSKMGHLQSHGANRAACARRYHLEWPILTFLGDDVSSIGREYQ